MFANKDLVRYMAKRIFHKIPYLTGMAEMKTVDEQIEKYGARARQRLEDAFAVKEAPYPPAKLTIVANKTTRQLELYAPGKNDGSMILIRTYPILGASGRLGPKLREGDCQVPEGIYRIQSLEPNTPYHLGLRVNYPNEFDLQHAREEGRTNPGGDILIHGNTGSVGCLAMGDQASEDLFVVAHDCKDQNIPIIICPVDFRSSPVPPSTSDDPKWLPQLYEEIKSKLSELPKQ